MRAPIWLLLVVAAALVLGFASACPKRLPHKQPYKPVAGERPGPSSQAEAGKLPGEAPPAAAEGETGEAGEAAEPAAEAGEETPPAEEEEAAGEPAEPSAEKPAAPEEKAAPLFVSARELETQMKDVVNVGFETQYGTFVIAVYPEIAPVSANHFLDLVKAGFYDGIAIHRVEPGFVVQMGQVTDENSARYHYTQEPIKDEPNYSENMPMTVAFAKQYTPEGVKQENSASTQFFVNLGDNRRLDPDFTVMGKVIHGGSVISSLSVGDKIGRAYVLGAQELPDIKRETGGR